MTDLRQYLRDHPFVGPFKPVPWYSETGDTVFWFWEDVRHFEEPVRHEGAWVGSLLRADDDRRVVGIKLHRESVANLPSR